MGTGTHTGTHAARERCVPSQVWCSTGARPSPVRHPGARPPLRLLSTKPFGPFLAVTLVPRCPIASREGLKGTLQSYAAFLCLFCEEIKANDELATQRGPALPDDATNTLFSVTPLVCECG